ncbi:GNAT family N-acetyltransferase [uncultured Arthrobacter sp.]|uniref:GNAT family N-acetyltransferase n=1 Tax=uncultured Arthrobacter sp. TaxID=114050 RepID=UPI00262C85A5|nr:GNAT family N-acetyltransferase [uncultured Arthrobacter sp.]
MILEPLAPDHATEMVAVLAPPELYTFIGGEPPTLDALRTRYQKQAVGHSPSDDAGWLNWIIRSQTTRDALGYVQATLTHENTALVADIAWLITPPAQHHGIATEATTTMLTWLQDHQVIMVRAFIHPDHEASARIAARLGLSATPTIVDGEVLWQHFEPSPPSGTDPLQ